MTRSQSTMSLTHNIKIALIGLFAACSQLSLAADVQVSTNQQLQDALNQSGDVDITLSAGLEFQPNNAFSVNLAGNYTIRTNPSNPAIIDGNNSTQSAFNINNVNSFNLQNVVVQNFAGTAITASNSDEIGLHGVRCLNNGSTQTMGGCVRTENVGAFETTNSFFQNNSAAIGGTGYIIARHTKITGSSFIGNQATQSGGDLTFIPTLSSIGRPDLLPGVWAELNAFKDFSAGQFGGAIELLGGNGAPEAHIANNTFHSPSAVPALELNYTGPVFIGLNSFNIGGDLFNSVSPSLVTVGNLIRIASSFNSSQIIPDTSPIATRANGSNCNVFAGQVLSFGFNIINSSGCPFNQATDQLNTSPGFVANDPTLNLQSDSPAVDAQPGEGLLNIPAMAAAVLPNEASSTLACGVADSTGLGRPQDANGDGVFECDLGARELRNGPDISAAQTMAVFDTGTVPGSVARWSIRYVVFYFRC